MIRILNTVVNIPWLNDEYIPLYKTDYQFIGVGIGMGSAMVSITENTQVPTQDVLLGFVEVYL